MSYLIACGEINIIVHLFIWLQKKDIVSFAEEIRANDKLKLIKFVVHCYDLSTNQIETFVSIKKQK